MQLAVSHSVTLMWAASTSTVAGYNVYRSGVASGPFVQQNSSIVAAIQYEDSTVQGLGRLIITKLPVCDV